MIVKDPTGAKAHHAGLLARRHYELRLLWRERRTPVLAQAMVDAQASREVFQHHTGWVADYDGETTVYHYTDPQTREAL